MNYSKIYKGLIERAQQRTPLNGYTEIHHIEPKALGGGEEACNLVQLTAREHFIAHRLLVKITAHPKMIYALWAMANQKNVMQDRNGYVTSREYERLKQAFSVVHSKRIVSEATRRLISEKAKQRFGDPEYHKRVTDARRAVVAHHSAESRKIRSDRMKGFKHTTESKRKIGAAHKGKRTSTETKIKLSESAKQRLPKRWMNMNGNTKHVYEKDIPTFIINGWKLGRGKLK